MYTNQTTLMLGDTVTSPLGLNVMTLAPGGLALNFNLQGPQIFMAAPHAKSCILTPTGLVITATIGGPVTMNPPLPPSATGLDVLDDGTVHIYNRQGVSIWQFTYGQGASSAPAIVLKDLVQVQGAIDDLQSKFHVLARQLSKEGDPHEKHEHHYGRESDITELSDPSEVRKIGGF
jgi:hypothetical protein